MRICFLGELTLIAHGWIFMYLQCSSFQGFYFVLHPNVILFGCSTIQRIVL